MFQWEIKDGIYYTRTSAGVILRITQKKKPGFQYTTVTLTLQALKDLRWNTLYVTRWFADNPILFEQGLARAKSHAEYLLGDGAAVNSETQEKAEAQ